MNDRLIPSAAEARTSPGASASACGTSQPHESARAQVQGQAPYVDDRPEPRGTLHAAPVLRDHELTAAMPPARPWEISCNQREKVG